MNLMVMMRIYVAFTNIEIEFIYFERSDVKFIYVRKIEIQVFQPTLKLNYVISVMLRTNYIENFTEIAACF